MKRHPPFALKSILLVCFAGFLLAGCRTTPKENSEDFAQIGEDEVLEERNTLNILSALDSGDIDKTRKYAELPMLIDASTLPYYATNGSLRFGLKEEMILRARQILDYVERHKDELKSRPNLSRPAVRGLQKTLTGPEEVRQLQELSDYFAAEDKK
jgi:hypothetical protein